MFSTETLQTSDIKELHQTVVRSRDHLEELGWLAQATLDQFSLHYEAILAMSALHISVIRIDGCVAGAVELQDHGHYYVIGYWLGVDYRGSGLATRAVQQVLDQYPGTIRADTLRRNPASARVLERLAFVLTHSDSERCYYERASVQTIDIPDAILAK